MRLLEATDDVPCLCVDSSFFDNRFMETSPPSFEVTEKLRYNFILFVVVKTVFKKQTNAVCLFGHDALTRLSPKTTLGLSRLEV